MKVAAPQAQTSSSGAGMLSFLPFGGSSKAQPTKEQQKGKDSFEKLDDQGSEDDLGEERDTVKAVTFSPGSPAPKPAEGPKKEKMKRAGTAKPRREEVPAKVKETAAVSASLPGSKNSTPPKSTENSPPAKPKIADVIKSKSNVDVKSEAATSEPPSNLSKSKSQVSLKAADSNKIEPEPQPQASSEKPAAPVDAPKTDSSATTAPSAAPQPADAPSAAPEAKNGN